MSRTKKDSEPMDIAIYGGSFNPPHLGHREAVITALEKLNPDLLLIIPDHEPPHKEMKEGSPSPEQRLELCRLTFSDLEKVEISALELERSGKSYTYDTVVSLRELYPDDFRAYCTYKRLLIKPVYAGIIHDIPDGCPAYITEDQHQMLMGRIGTRSPIKSNIYIFSGLLHCPQCGGKLTYHKCGQNDKYVYYICHRAYANRMCDYRVYLREDRIEAALTAYIFTPGDLSLNGVEATQRPTRAAPTPSQIKAKLKRLAETYTDGLIDREAYKRQTAELKEQLTAAEMPSRSPSEPPVTLIQELIQGDIQSTYSGLSRQEKYRFWARILQACTLDEEYQIKAITFFDS